MKSITFLIALSILYSCTLTAQWTHIGLEGRSIRDIACGNNAIFAVTADSGSVMRSTDQGNTWQMIFSSAVGSLISSANGTILLVKRSVMLDTIFSSTDHGSSWTTSLIAPIYYSDHHYTLTFSPNGTIFCYAQNPYIYRSTDVGQSWDTISVFAGNWSGVLYLGFLQDGSVVMDRYISFWGGGGVEFLSISSDNGTTWNENGAVIGGTIAIDHEDRIYFTAKPNWGEWGIFRSDDLGLTSEEISEIIPTYILPLPSGGILAGTNGGGLYLFSENGDSLGTLNEGLTNLNVHTLAMDSLGYVYAGTDSGVFRIANFVFSPATIQHLSAGWNLLSLPIHPNDHNKAHNYPGALSAAFEYTGGYRQREELAVCKGYWLKVGSESYFSLWGNNIYMDSINVSARWNLIGSLSEPFPASTITSEPPGIITSSFWEYDGTQYNESDTIYPGKGYWVKVSENGKLILSTTQTVSAPSNYIKIIADGELPPPAPDGLTGDVKSVLPDKFAIEQNYPNPFNPQTTIHYQLPVESKVTIKIYNLLGQEVKTLVDEMQDAGYKSVMWNAPNIPSGVYFYRLKAGTFTETRKLLLLR